jgi:DNA (cytosine-5)-methyltransferase 1
MRFGSVCSGIEAASVAWHPLGWEAAWLSEIEPFPCAVLKHHYPDVPNHGDMTLLPDRILSGEVEAPDLFCGGTPCQAFSVAGLRNSLDDARGNLSLTFVGIANAIDHVRSVRRDAPAIIFWENVPGVLNTKDNAFGCFLGALAGESEQIVPPGDKWTNSGCVFGPQRTVAWRVLDAQYFGVAQRRRRVFVVASARNDFNPAEVLFEFEGVRRDIAPSRQARKVTPTISSSGTGVSRVGFNCEDEWFIETPVIADCGVQLSGPLSARDYKDAGTDGMNKILAKMVPVVQELVGALDTECGGNKLTHQSVSNGHIVAARMVAFGEYSVDGTASAMKARDWKDATDLVAQPAYAIQGSMIGRNDNAGPQGDGINVELCFTQNTIDRHAVAQPIAYSFDSLASNSMKSSNPHSGCNPVDVSKALDTSRGLDPSCNQGGIGVAQPIGVDIFNAAFSGEVAVPLTNRSDGTGTGPTVMQAVGTDCFNGNITGDIACTMGTMGSSVNASGPTVMQAMAVRRLTPTECERLQGFPDGYTNIPWRKAAESPDGPRYKALGNSWAVPVVRWIGKRIQERITT